MNKIFTIYYNECRQQATNAKYPICKEIHNCDDFREVVSYDHVCVQYKDNHRKKEHFLQADCCMFDVDNVSDNPEEWILPDDIEKTFPNVSHYISFSRNHMKEKNGKTARPKFHVYFPHAPIVSVNEYEQLKETVCSFFPEFDENAKDAARFFFGVENPTIKYVDGEMSIMDMIKALPADFVFPQENDSLNQDVDIIPEGKRNTTLYSYALKRLTRWGDTDKSYHAYIEVSKKCSPLLDPQEIGIIWDGACKYYHEKILTSSDYISPELYGSISSKDFMPKDFTDVGQARILTNLFGDLIRYSAATKFLYYTGKVWIEDEIKVHGLVQALTELQLKNAQDKIQEAHKMKSDAEIRGDKKTEDEAKKDIDSMRKYQKFILRCRDSRNISGIMREVQPMIEIEMSQLDADGLMLNTPAGLVDLRSGHIAPHKPTDYCTKITSVEPTNMNKEYFQEFLKTITCGDVDLQEYLQMVAGLFIVGTVFCENLIIAYGSGRNGKSTLFNLLARIIGDYAGSLSAEVLTSSNRKNKSPEIAELRGKRLVIAAELEEGMRLDTAVVKKLCSTDPIYAEKKYKDPFRFTPSHTIVLYTNHLPKVGTIDQGTWRRLIVIPFNALIEGAQDIKNYADLLYHKAGGAVLTWMIEGAKKFLEANCKIAVPEVVQRAIEQYRAENDWLRCFIADKCELGSGFTQQAGALYKAYRDCCKENGERYMRSAVDFKKAMEEAGYYWKKTSKGAFYYGIKLTNDFEQTKIVLTDFHDHDWLSSPAMTEDDDEFVKF